MDPPPGFQAPFRFSTLHRESARPQICATAGGGPRSPEDAFDQYEQYDGRNKDALARELAIARALPVRQRHYHFFLHIHAEAPFRSAVDRFFDGVQASESTPDWRLWALRSTEDPTFGSLRGEPFPPRAWIVEPLKGDSGVGKWTQALDRAGPAFSPMESHFVDWGVVDVFGTGEERLAEHEVVSTEILNANWTRATSVPLMKAKLLAHAKQVVERGEARLFEVFQSVDEATCFKTIEVYSDVDALRKHMLTLDPAFASDVMDCRAAVNRVRQLYKFMRSVHQ